MLGDIHQGGGVIYLLNFSNKHKNFNIKYFWILKSFSVSEWTRSRPRNSILVSIYTTLFIEFKKKHWSHAAKEREESCANLPSHCYHLPCLPFSEEYPNSFRDFRQKSSGGIFEVDILLIVYYDFIFIKWYSQYNWLNINIVHLEQCRL